MDVLDAIRSRRSLGKVKPDEIEPEIIEEIIKAGICAPNHYMTEPWRFIVMTGEGRRRLGNAYADIALQAADPDFPGEEKAKLAAVQKAKAIRAPVVIAVTVTPSAEPTIPQIEEMAAVHAAVQNMLLAIHGLGLAAIWRTGAPTYHPIMHTAFDLEPKEQLVGFIYLGYPNMVPPPMKRQDFREKTVWITE